MKRGSLECSRAQFELKGVDKLIAMFSLYSILEKAQELVNSSTQRTANSFL